MRGREALRARIDARRQKRHTHIGGGKDFSFTFLNTRDLVATRSTDPYIFRVLGSNEKKCPEGIGFKALHTIEIKPGKKSEGGEWAHVMAKEAWPDPDKADASEMIDGLLDYLDDPRILDTLDDNVVNAINRLEAKTEYLLPTIWYGSWQEVMDGGELKRRFIAKNPEEVEPTGFIFSITADSLYDAIDAIAEDDSNFTSYQNGRNLKFSKTSNNKYTVMPELKTSPLDPRASTLVSDDEYPSIAKMVNKGMMSVEQVENLLQQSWWWSYVSPFFE